MIQVLSLLRPELGLHASTSGELLAHYALEAAQRFCRDSGLWLATTYDGPVPADCVIRLRPADTSVLSLYIAVRQDTAFAAADFGAVTHGPRVTVPRFVAASHVAIAYPAGRTLRSVTNSAVGGGDTELRGMFRAGPHVELGGANYETVVSVRSWFAFIAGSEFHVSLLAASEERPVAGVPSGATIWKISSVRADDEQPKDVPIVGWDPATGELTLDRDHCMAKAVRVRAVLEPLTDATELPPQFRRWRSAIVQAALVQLLAMQRMEWYSPPGVMRAEHEYRRHLRDALSAAGGGYAGLPRSVPPPELA